MNGSLDLSLPMNAQPAAHTTCSDEALMLELRRGANEALSELFRRYRQPIWGFFRRRVNDSARAEELTQETFLAVLSGAKRYQPRAAFRSYLFGIAFNLLAAERRKAAAREPLSLEAAALEVVGRDDARENETVLAVKQALARLDADDREVLMLREYEQLRYEEIATVLGVPVGTVRSRLFRARMALKELLAPRHREGPSG